MQAQEWKERLLRSIAIVPYFIVLGVIFGRNITISWVYPQFLVLIIFLVFYVVLLCVFTFWVPCCVGFKFSIQTMFGSPLPPVVCMGVHVLFTLFVLAWVANSDDKHMVCCVFLRTVYSVLPVSLGCPFLIAPSVFSNVF